MIDAQKCTIGLHAADKACALVFSSLLLIALAQAAPGQTAPEPQAAPAPVPAATANVNEVTLDLVVHDKKQRQVLDLTAGDLAVTDNDAPVKLKDFHLVKADSGAVHIVTLVFDRFRGGTARNAQTTAEKILKALPDKGYSFALLDVAGRLRLIQGFTANREAIQQAIKVETDTSVNDKAPVIELESTNLVVNKSEEKPDAAKSRAAIAEKDLIAIAQTGADSAGNHVDVETRARCRVLLKALEGARQIQQDEHTQPQLAGLLSLVRSQQGLQARKAVVYFTHNAQLDSAAKEMLHKISGAANQAGVTLYVVDMDALDVGGKYQIDTAIGGQNATFNGAAQPIAGSQGHASTGVTTQEAGPGGPTSTVGMAVDWLRQSDPHPFTEIKSPLATMAQDTGGAYMDAQDNIKKPLQQMVGDLTTYYQASYVPPIEEYDGSFRAIGIKPLRAGVEIKTRTGYFALASDADGAVRPFEAPLLKLLSLPEPPTELKFHAALLKFGELPDGNTSAVAVEVPISELQAKTDARTGLYSAHVSVVAQIKDKSGTVVEHFSEDIARRGALESYDKGTAEPVTLERHFMAIPGQYTLEVAVLDQAGEKAGVQRIPFEIPAVQTTPSLSEIVLVRKVDTFHQEDDPDEPLRYEKGKITPNLAGTVPEHAKSVSLFFILHRDPTSKGPVTLEIAAGRNGRPGKLTALPLSLQGSSGAVPYLASFSSGLAPGDYEVKAAISQDGKTDVRSLSFTVDGQEAASGDGLKSSPQGHGGGVSSDGAPSGDTPTSGLLAITPITNPVPPLSPNEATQLIEDARSHAVSYADSLPNFLCVEVTDRSFDPTGTGQWRHRDTIAELLSYRDKKETHTMLEVNGQASNVDRNAMKGKKAAFSAGEFGGVLSSVFSPAAKADFQWKETDSLGAGTVQVFRYRVEKINSSFAVVGMNDLEVMAAFHGLVFIDSATHNVRRITMVADGLPADFPTHSTSLAVDYDYVSINGHDFLLPISGEMSLRQGRHEDILNTIEFRDYRKFGSNVRIVEGFTPVDKQ